MILNPRHFVPLAALPPLPDTPAAYLCTECGSCGSASLPVCGHHEDKIVSCLSLSAPEAVNDSPPQLDMLELACTVLAGWHGLLPFNADDVICLRQFFSNARVWRVCGVNKGAQILTQRDPGFDFISPRDPDCVRAALAAALLKGPPATFSSSGNICNRQC